MVAVAGFVGGMFSFGATAGALGAGAVGAAWAGSGFAATVLGGLAVKLLTSVAISALSQALASDPAQGGGITISTTLRGEENPETILLGRYATAGQAICPPMSWGGSHKQLVYVLELCSAPGATLGRVRIGDEWASFGDEHADGRGRELVTEAYGRGRIWIRYHDGSQTQADPYLLARFGADPDRPWTARMVGRGLCYAVITWRYHPEKMPAVPKYLFEMQGLPLYDIRKDGSAGGVGSQRLANPATWTQTDNPIVMIWNIMHGITLPGGERWGGGMTDPRSLPQASWVTAMTVCDQAIARKGAASEPRFRAGLEISLADPPAAAIEELLKAAAATIADQGYGWTVQAGGPGLPVYVFGDRDIIVSETQELDPFPSLDETSNAVSAKYPEPEEFWETKEAPRRTNADWEAADVFGRRTASINLPAVPYGNQVQRLMRAWIEAERRFRRHSVSLPPDSAHLDLCDTASWTSARNGYETKGFEVCEINEDLRTGIRRPSLREVDPSDYGWTLDDELPSAVVSPTRTPPAVETVPGWSVTAIRLKDAGGTDRRVGIRMSWDSDAGGTGLRWQIRLYGAAEPEFEGTETDIEAGRRTVAGGILPATSYQVRGILLSRRPTSWTAWTTVTTPAVTLGAQDLDVDAIKGDILAQIEDFEAFIAEVPDRLADIEAEIGEATGVIDDLYGIVDANLTTARDYTDTRISSERVTRETAIEALALQISELAATPQGENYIVNGSFADGLDGWTAAAGSVSVVARNAASTNPLIAAAPTGSILAMAAGATRSLVQDFAIGSWAGGEHLKYRVYLGTRGTGHQLNIRLRYYNASGTQIGAPTTSITLTKDQWKVYTGSAEIPAGAVTARFELVLVGATATQDVYATEISVEKADMAILSRVTSLEVAQATTSSALAGLVDEVEAGLTDLRTGQTATGNAVSSLTTRVATAEGKITSQGNAITSLQTAVAGKAAASAVTALTTRVATAEGKITSQGSAITSLQAAVAGKAAASAVTALTTRVSAAEGKITAQADSITQVSSRTDRLRASGLIRMVAATAPTGAQTRVAIQAQATAADTSHSAALYVEADSDGGNAVGVVAGRFYVAQGSAPGAARKVPFIVQGGTVYIDAAMIGQASIKGAHIGDLEVDTVKIKDGAITKVFQGSGQVTSDNTSTPVTVASISFNVPSASIALLKFDASWLAGGGANNISLRLYIDGVEVQRPIGRWPGSGSSASSEPDFWKEGAPFGASYIRTLTPGSHSLRIAMTTGGNHATVRGDVAVAYWVK